ncbi:TPA: transketolase [bacterium]|nr:transketolase [bacterium]
MSSMKLDKISIEYRKEILNIINYSRRGHIPPSLSIVEIIRVLYEDILNISSKNPFWEDRDRFILSKGHGCLTLYVALAKKGFFPKEELYRFCKSDTILGGHPEYIKIPGVEASTGSLGHGLSIGIGFALNARLEKKNYRTFVLLGDGECQEGSVWEAALCASKHKLNRLIAIIDYNKMQCYGKISEVLELEPFSEKWRDFGFVVKEVDGHDIKALRKVFQNVPFDDKKPSVIICHTVKGKGIPFLENNASWHHKSGISDEEMKKMFEGLEK